MNAFIQEVRNTNNDINLTNECYKKYTLYIDKIYEYSISKYFECEELIKHYKSIKFDEMDDNKIYQEICWVIYSSGFKNTIIQKYWPNITKAYYNFNLETITKEYEDSYSSAKLICKRSNFNNINKAKFCIYNAHRIAHINISLQNIGLKGILKAIVNMDELNIYNMIPEIKNQLGFKGIGNITIFHFLKNIGVNIFKPDIHVSRILKYIGLFEETSSQKEMFYILKQISESLKLDVSSLDTALFIFGKNNESNLEYMLEKLVK